MTGKKDAPPGSGQMLFDWDAPPDALPTTKVAQQARDGCRWPPSHPWYYCRAGDNAEPVPFDEIPASKEAGKLLANDLPKARAKRIIKVRELGESERASLAALRKRYEDVVARGAEALSKYDREIAFSGNDDLARAGTLALLFNQITGAKGRIAALIDVRQIASPRR